MYLRMGLLLMLWTVASTAMSQGNKVTGKVTDQNGEALPGVTILEKGTSNGTITDIEGAYSINVGKESILNFSFVGFKSQSVPVNGRAQIDITLSDDILQMNEVVVVGYGTVNKKDLTGSVAMVGKEDFENQPVVRLESALQSKVPGVMINRNSGNPGSPLKVRIRGMNSYGGGNDPLYVIDGYIGANISSINPNDIESLSILKDASATALYGSQGSNGVIIITTKLSKGDKAKVSVNYRHGISYLRKKWDLMNSWQYMQTVDDRISGDGTIPVSTPLFDKKTILQAQSQNRSTDWQDVVFQPGSQDQVQVTVQKGGFLLSGAAQTNKGIVSNTHYNRYNFRMNYSENIFKPVKLFISLSDAYEDRMNANDEQNTKIIRSAVGWPPNLTPFDTATNDYTKNQAYGPLTPNPSFSLYQTPTKKLSNDLLANSYLEFKLADGLKFKTLAAAEIRGNVQTNFSRVDPNQVSSTPLNSSYSNFNETIFRWQATQQLMYNKTFGVHHINASALYEVRSNVERQFSSSGSQLTTTDLGYYSAPVAAIQKNGVNKQNTEIRSFFGKIDYTLADKYLFTLNVRNDASSRLAAGYRGATFFSGAFAYKLSNENFLKNIKAIEELKLRMSAGQVGSQAVNFLETVQTVGYNIGYSFDGSTYNRGANITSPKNHKLTWETTNQADIGLDLSIFKGRINFTLDAYYKRTSGLIFNKPVPQYAGGGSIKVNAGQMENKGMEFMTSGYIIDKKDFSIEVSGNISFYRNKLMSIVGNANYIKSGLSQRDYPDLLDNSHRNFVGQPIGQIWGLVYEGVYSTSQKEEASKYNRSPGDPIYKDLNGDGKIDNQDMKVIGNPNPKFMYGFNTTIKYKKFTMNMVWGGVQGVDILNSLLWSTYGGGQRDATNVDVLNRWSPTNQSSNIPGYTATSVSYRQSSQWIQNGSYLKLRNVTVKYDLPIKSISWMKAFSQMSVFVTAQNALVFTKYSGYDPESISNTGDKAGGFDQGGYPIPRTFMSGINFSF